MERWGQAYTSQPREDAALVSQVEMQSLVAAVAVLVAAAAVLAAALTAADEVEPELTEAQAASHSW